MISKKLATDWVQVPPTFASPNRGRRNELPAAFCMHKINFIDRRSVMKSVSTLVVALGVLGLVNYATASDTTVGKATFEFSDRSQPATWTAKRLNHGRASSH